MVFMDCLYFYCKENKMSKASGGKSGGGGRPAPIPPNNGPNPAGWPNNNPNHPGNKSGDGRNNAPPRK